MPTEPAAGGYTLVSGPSITLPAGVTVGAGRETSQTTAGGQVVQGMVFPITTPAGSNTSVFIPYSQIHNTAEVEQLIAARAAAIIAISG
jgi:hypothetical protein